MYYAVFILDYLMQGPCYGYEIKKQVEHGISACTTLSNNAIYPLLRGYEKQGATTKSIESVIGKPNRIIYSITPVGRKLFADTLRKFPDALMLNREEFLTRMAFFHYLNEEARERALRLRKDFLTHSLNVLGQSEAAELPDDIKHRADLHDFHVNLNLLELKVIETFEQKIHMPCLLSDDGYIISP